METGTPELSVLEIYRPFYQDGHLVGCVLTQPIKIEMRATVYTQSSRFTNGLFTTNCVRNKKARPCKAFLTVDLETEPLYIAFNDPGGPVLKLSTVDSGARTQPSERRKQWMTRFTLAMALRISLIASNECPRSAMLSYTLAVCDGRARTQQDVRSQAWADDDAKLDAIPSGRCRVPLPDDVDTC